MKKTILILAVISSAICCQAKETWLTGTPFVSAGNVLLFRTDAMLQNNSGGRVLLLGTTRNAVSLLPALQAAAGKRVALRLYGDISMDPNNNYPPGYQGDALPNMRFIIWKIHMPDEIDTWDAGVKPSGLLKEEIPLRNGQPIPNAPARQLGSTGQVRPFSNVDPDSQLMKNVRFAMLRHVYRGNEEWARTNPNGIRFRLGRCITNGETVFVKALGATGKGAVKQAPMLLILTYDGQGNLNLVKDDVRFSREEKANLIRIGFPEDLF